MLVTLNNLRCQHKTGKIKRRGSLRRTSPGCRGGEGSAQPGPRAGTQEKRQQSREAATPETPGRKQRLIPSMWGLQGWGPSQLPGSPAPTRTQRRELPSRQEPSCRAPRPGPPTEDAQGQTAEPAGCGGSPSDPTGTGREGGPRCAPESRRLRPSAQTGSQPLFVLGHLTESTSSFLNPSFQRNALEHQMGL